MTAIYKHTRYQNEAKLQYGIDDYLIKPLLPSSIAGLVRRAQARPNESLIPRHTRLEPSGRGESSGSDPSIVSRALCPKLQRVSAHSVLIPNTSPKTK